jgi:aryl sulfotransferase
VTTTEQGTGAMTVLCASYPKSGNTWLRALLTAHTQGGAVDINSLDGGDQPGAHAMLFDRLGLGISTLAGDSVEPLRRLTTQLSNEAAGAPVFRKVHDAYGPACDGIPRFLPEHTRLVAYVVRDPRAVAVSWAHHLSVTHETAVEIMRSRPPASDFDVPWLSGESGYHLGTWSEHVESWIDQRDLPVAVVRYEDLLLDATAGLRRVLEASGMEVRPAHLRAAAEACSFDALATQEILGGFIEAPRSDRPFFRRGEAASWQRELSPALVASIERDHGAVMERLGYLIGDRG